MSESSYMDCGSHHNAVAHSGVTNNMFVVFFQWVAPYDFDGEVWFKGVVRIQNNDNWSELKTMKIVVNKGKTKNTKVSIPEDTKDLNSKTTESVNGESTQGLGNVQYTFGNSTTSITFLFKLLSEKSEDTSMIEMDANCSEDCSSIQPYERIQSALGSWNQSSVVNAGIGLFLLMTFLFH